LFAETESMAEAAALLYGAKFGDGDHVFFYKELIENGGALVLKKLYLMRKPIFNNTFLAKDSIPEDKIATKVFAPSNHYKFQLWRKFVVIQKSITEQEFIELYPKAVSKIEWWK